LRRGEIRWYTFRLPDKRRPVLILTRSELIEVLTTDDGMPTVCALNFDHVALAQRDRIGPALCSLPESRWVEVRRALLIACGFDEPAAI